MKTFALNLPVRLRPRLPNVAWFWLLAGFLALALLASCGGGGGGVGSNGTGAVNQGVASGTVTGFGSIIVDGVRFDDSTATVRITRSDTDDSAGGVKAEVKLGQQLSFTFAGGTEDKGVALSITVLPTLIGEAKPYSKGISITVNGLTVIINTDPALGPVTVVDDSVDLNATLSTGSRVEVHAIQGANGLVATRIEESPVTGDLVRGIVKAVSGAFAIATIGDLQVDMSAVPSAQTKALVVGQTVTVFGTFDATNSLTPFKAKRIHSDAAVVTSKVDDYLGGFITQYNASNQTFVINGVNVDAATAAIKSKVVLANGQYVRVRGTTVATTSGAVFKATSVQLRKDETQSQGGDADLIGNILGLVQPVDPSQPATFSLRDVFVNVPSTVARDFTRCGASALVNGMYVEVKGNTTASGVTATSLLCDNEPTTAGTKVERVGTVAADSPSANTVTVGTFQFLVSATETITVVYDAETFFRATPSSPLDGTKLKAGTPLDIEGVFSVTGTGTSQVQVLRATKIKKE
jgi:cold shock CspA family protein